MGKKLNLGHVTLIKNWVVAHFISVTHDQTFTDDEKLKARENIGVEAIVGKLADLTTTVKTNIVAAINSIAGSIIEGVVTGVKGDAETEYRKGDVNITKDNIGLGNVDNTADMDKPMSTATKEYVDEQISTNSATYRGSVTATDDSTEAAVLALATISTKDNNDYAHVEVPNFPSEGLTKVKRYKFVVVPGGTGAWSFEYALNNTGFTADQLAALNSGITSGKVELIAENAAAIANINTDLETVKSDIAGVKEVTNQLTATIDTLGERVDAAETSITAIEQSITKLADDLNLIINRVTSIEAEVITINSRVDLVEAKVNALEPTVEEHSTAIEEISGKFDSAVSSDNQAQGKTYIDAGDEEATDAEVTAALNAE